MKYKLTVRVRKVNAIGIFYPVDFIVEVPDNSTTKEIKAKWFEDYGNEWELYYFVKLDEIKDASTN